MMFLPRISLGIYPQFPHYYVVAMRAKNEEVAFLWQQRYLFSQVLDARFAYYSMSIPWSICHFSILSDLSNAKPYQYKYLGLNSGKKSWLGLNYLAPDLQAYLAMQGPWVKQIDDFAPDILALWSYAYWLLPQFSAFNQRVLWIFEHSSGAYYLYGRNENLWAMEQELGAWMKAWPSPERVICFNAKLNQTMPLSLPIEYLSHLHYAWIMAQALAIRGAYAIF